MVRLGKSHVWLALTLAAVSLLSGCTNWRQKYEYLNVENENLKGRMQRTQTQQKQLTDRIAQDQKTIEELTRQIETMHQTPAEASGFGPGLDVSFGGPAAAVAHVPE